MKKILSILLALLLLCPAALAAFAAEAGAGAFAPVMRFLAASDTHVLENSDQNEQRIGKMMALAYGVAAADPAYHNVDALLLAGDLTNDGTKTEFDKFWSAVSGALQGDTRFLGVVAKNHDGWGMKRAEMRDTYTALSGNEADFHAVIGGYHFIGVSASSKDGQHYDRGQLTWRRRQLDAAVAEDPDRPVFVTHHEHVRGTVYGSSLYDGWGVPYFTAILNQYPQVVDFSGHSHFPLNDPRSIWQGRFTAVGTGAIYYSEFTVEGLRSYHPADSGDTATCWIVELDKDSNLRLRGYDVLAGALLCEEILLNPADPANREYTPAKRRAASKAPVFAAGDELTAEVTLGGVSVTAPVAASADGMPVTLYRACAKDKFGVTAAESWVLPSYYRAVEQGSVTLELAGLAAGDYTVCVTAENAYGGRSQPICAQVTVEGETVFSAFFARIAQWFRSLKDYITQLFR